MSHFRMWIVGHSNSRFESIPSDSLCESIRFVKKISLGHGLHTSPYVIHRSTQPCIPPGSLNRVPPLAGVKAGMSALPGGG